MNDIPNLQFRVIYVLCMCGLGFGSCGLHAIYLLQ